MCNRSRTLTSCYTACTTHCTLGEFLCTVVSASGSRAGTREGRRIPVWWSRPSCAPVRYGARLFRVRSSKLRTRDMLARPGDLPSRSDKGHQGSHLGLLSAHRQILGLSRHLGNSRSDHPHCTGNYSCTCSATSTCLYRSFLQIRSSLRWKTSTHHWSS